MSKHSKNFALITGASSGIGESTAKELAKKGYSLFLVARREDRLLQLKKLLTESYKVSVEYLALDLAEAGASEKLFNAATKDGKQIQILVNNAGIGPYGDFLASDLNRHLGTLALNNQALTEMCYRFSPHMLAQKNPCFIMNVSSVASFQGTKKFAVYAASKAYVLIFSEILGAELAGSNITVSCLCPGGTYTEFLEKNGQQLKGSGKSFMMTADQVAKIGVEEMLAKQRVIIPGMLNKLVCLLPRVLPRGLALNIASKTMHSNVSEKN